MAKNRAVIFTYSLAHFTVDFACAFLLFRVLYGKEQWYMCLLLYNFCAFALQMPLGLLADQWNKNSVCASIGCGLIALSFGFGSIAVSAAVLAGIGNGLFHVGGGIDVLNISKENPTVLGIFVSPGAFGIYLGSTLGKHNEVPALLVILVLFTIGISILVVCRTNKRSFCSNNVPISFQGIATLGKLLAILFLLIVVFLRSYTSMILNFPWKSTGSWSILYIFSIVFGKISGGFLAAKYGVFKTSTVSLGLAAVLFLFSNYPLAGVAAVFFFNMTMPITLWAMAKLLPGSKGFAFGLLTFLLFLGFVPVYLGYDPLFSTSLGFALAALVSLLLLWAGLRRVAI